MVDERRTREFLETDIDASGLAAAGGEPDDSLVEGEPYAAEQAILVTSWAIHEAFNHSGARRGRVAGFKLT